MFKLLGGLFGSIFGGYKTILIGLAIIGMLSGGFYWYFKWSQHEIATLAANNAKLEMAVQQQKQTIEAMVAFQKKQAQDLGALQKDLEDTRKYGSQLEEKLAKHDLEMLARKKPGLIENRINRATSDIFKQLEIETGATP